jgi:hypothetical protein
MHQRSSKPRSFIALAAVIGLTPATAPAGQDELAIDTAMAGPVLKFDWPTVAIGTASYEVRRNRHDHGRS